MATRKSKTILEETESDMIPRDIGKIWGAIRELKAALIGIDGKNGLRGEVKLFAEETKKHLLEQDKKLDNIGKWKDSVENRFKFYLEHERAATCVGVQALKEYISELEEITTEKEMEKKKEEEEQAAIEMNRETNKTNYNGQKLAMIALIISAVIASAGSVISTYISVKVSSEIKNTVSASANQTP